LQYKLEGDDGWITAVAFSPDGLLIASASSGKNLGNGIVGLSDSRTGALWRVLEVGFVSSLSFSIDGSRLETNQGPIELGIAPLDPTPAISWPPPSYTLSHNKTWVMWNGHNILWLPPEYRPWCSQIQDNTLAMGHASGRVTVIRFKPNPFPIL
jgi:WD40 repeat protein